DVCSSDLLPVHAQRAVGDAAEPPAGPGRSLARPGPGAHGLLRHPRRRAARVRERPARRPAWRARRARQPRPPLARRLCPAGHRVRAPARRRGPRAPPSSRTADLRTTPARWSRASPVRRIIGHTELVTPELRSRLARHGARALLGLRRWYQQAGRLALVVAGVGALMAFTTAGITTYTVIELHRFGRAEPPRAPLAYAPGQPLAPGISVRAVDLAGTLTRLKYRETSTIPATPGHLR